MPTLGDVLEGKEICICAGSGGVGKTTTSAAIATGMAAQGLKVCVLTIDPAKRLADSLGLEELGNEARRVDPALFEKQGVEMKGELWAMMLDAKATFDELVARQAPDEESRDRVLENRIYQQISSALAGSQEYMAMEKLFELHTEGELRPARPRHAADPQRARLPRRAETADPVHRGPLAAGLHEADRAGGEGRRPRRLGRARRLQADRRLRPARRPGRVLQRLQRHGRRLPGAGQAGQQAARRPRAPASSSSAARRASRSTRPSTSTANWSRRSCPSAASSSTRSTTRPRSCAARPTTCRRRWPRSSATRTWPGGWRRTSPTTRRWPSATPATSSTWPTELRTSGVIRVPYLDEDVHDLAGLAEINRYLFATGEERVAMAAGPGLDSQRARRGRRSAVVELEVADLPVGVSGPGRGGARGGCRSARGAGCRARSAAGHSSESPRRPSETSSSHGVAVILISSSAGIGSMMRVSCSMSFSSVDSMSIGSAGTRRAELFDADLGGLRIGSGERLGSTASGLVGLDLLADGDGDLGVAAFAGRSRSGSRRRWR